MGRAQCNGNLGYPGLGVAQKALQQANISASEIAAIGITNQRETTVVWDRHSGEPIHHAIVWQDRRTAPLCEQLKSAGHEALVRNKTGLVIDAYFSGTKVRSGCSITCPAPAQKRKKATCSSAPLTVG